MAQVRTKWALDGIAGAAVGIFSGLFGVGGGVVAVPALTASGLRPKQAHATSLVVVGLVALSGAISYGLTGRVAWLLALLLATGGIVGSQLGASLMIRLPSRALTVAFALFLVAVAVWTFLELGSSRSTAGEVEVSLLASVFYVLLGIAIGILSALLGVGGGVIMVPALVLVGGLDQVHAEGTSLAAMVLIALAGSLRLWREGYVQVGQGTRVALVGMLTAPLGVAAAVGLDSHVLQRLFAVLILTVACQMLWAQWRPAHHKVV